MDATHIGDSYDLVKQVLLDGLVRVHGTVAIDPMPTKEKKCCKFTTSEKRRYKNMLRIDQRRITIGWDCKVESCGADNIFLDPTTGIALKGNKDTHLTLSRIPCLVNLAHIVMVFDQGFSRSGSVKQTQQKREKMKILRKHGVRSMYYGSHACFLFASRSQSALNKLRRHYLKIVGIPPERFEPQP